MGVPNGTLTGTDNAKDVAVDPSGAAYITGEILTVDGGAWLDRGTFGFTP